MHLTPLDITVVCLYALFIFVLAQLVSREKAGHQKNSQDYFLASRSLPWWAIGTSLIAANISAEQLIGMSGSGYAIGLAIASYEWMAALTLLIVGVFFLPVFLKNEIYTMPEFLKRRYGPNIQFVMAILWLLMYVFVNLTSILWLGSTAFSTVTGLTQQNSLLILAAFTGAYALYGGLKAIALTDIVQVTMLVLGGTVILFISLTHVSGDVSALGALHGFQIILQKVPNDHFHMILHPDNQHFKDLPGISVIIGGMWVANLSYWGFNQYIIQRGLAAKSIHEAQKGIVLAAFLKLLIPLLVVVPGIAAILIAPGIRNDQAYPTLMTLLPPGLLGIVFAALIAAIIASLGSKVNSIATIFTMDVFKTFNKKASEKTLVVTGRITAIVALIIAVLVAKPLIGGFDQAFQFIQDFSGFFTPGITVIFLLGLFWKRATEAGALVAAIGSVLISTVCYLGERIAHLSFVAPHTGVSSALLYLSNIPFMNRMGYTFLICTGLAVVASLLQKPKPEAVTVDVTHVDYSTTTAFKIAAGAIVAILIALYATWW
ncbi:MAG: sodium/solute symporter [Rhizomicrobium sp.]|nr:sodium/solute symporter [Rhizomicrobium sp.]